MCEEFEGGRGQQAPAGAICLGPQGSAALVEALRQMDCLQRSRHEDVGLRHLVGMLRALRIVRREVS